jgi:hypothetical protein
MYFCVIEAEFYTPSVCIIMPRNRRDLSCGFTIFTMMC